MKKEAEMRAEFYRRRDQRTQEYLRLPRGNEISFADALVHISIDVASAGTPAGQLALLSLANMVARVHQRVTFGLPDPNQIVLVDTSFAGGTLAECLMTTVKSIDPYGSFLLAETRPDASLCLGVGGDIAGKNNCDWYIGADLAVAHLTREPSSFTASKATLRGAALAACLGAAAIFRAAIGRDVTPRVLSAWNYAEDKYAESGPQTLSPLQVGSVLVAGVGAVGSAMAYWLNAFGVNAHDWAVLDGDRVELHNTNRSLVFTAGYAGWPEGQPAKKVDVVNALLPGATPFSAWYDECPEVQQKRFDVILCLANDRAVRHLLACRNAPVALQATTSENWMSQLHRHIPGRDDCIFCRTGEVQAPIFGCSTTSIEEPDGKLSDAALPFLSAASGLMLATALQRLQCGELGDSPANDWRWDFDSPGKMASVGTRVCKDGCNRIYPANVRNKINSGRLWTNL